LESEGSDMNTVNLAEELQKIREAMMNSVSAAFDRLLQSLENGDAAMDLPAEIVYPFTADTNIFIGKKPVAVLFGEERVKANNWRKVFAAIMARCNADAQCHDNLMYLRDKVAGRDRILLSHSS
jgi:hypothetical protein